MATFTSLGIGSGVDLNSMVTQLVALERAPLVGMQSAAKKLQTQVSSFGQIQSLFGTLQDASNKLTGSGLWTQGVASSTDSTVVSASGGAGAAVVEEKRWVDGKDPLFAHQSLRAWGRGSRSAWGTT